MIRVLKIFLILISFGFTGVLLYLIFFKIIGRSNIDLSYNFYIYLSIALITAKINIVYHIISFRFYRRKKSVDLTKKIPKILWLGSIGFASFTLFISGSGLYSITSLTGLGIDYKQLFFIISFFAVALLSFLELSLLRNRIKQLQTAQENKDSIETIGDSFI